MKRICLLSALLLALCYSNNLEAQLFKYALPPTFDSLVNRYGTTLSQILDTFYAHVDPNDTEEGGMLSQLNSFTKFWQGRAVLNDSSGQNMFRQYFNALRAAVIAGEASPCSGSGSFSGNWACIGPDSLPIQGMGRVDAVWADSADSNYILAGTMGGLFRTTDGGKNWMPITDNSPIVGGVIGVSSIAVNPKNLNTIYLGTSDMGGFYNGGTEAGAGILKSFDGGNTWQQEFVGAVCT